MGVFGNGLQVVCIPQSLADDRTVDKESLRDWWNELTLLAIRVRGTLHCLLWNFDATDPHLLELGKVSPSDCKLHKHLDLRSRPHELQLTRVRVADIRDSTYLSPLHLLIPNLFPVHVECLQRRQRTTVVPTTSQPLMHRMR